MIEAATDADAEHVRDSLDVPNDVRSPHKRATKSLAKSKKRSTDRKRKGSSWYNVRSFLVFSLTVLSFLRCS